MSFYFLLCVKHSSDQDKDPALMGEAFLGWDNHGSLKMEEKSQKSKETICLYRGSCVFYKGEFLELVGDFIFLCPGEKEGHQIGQTGA